MIGEVRICVVIIPIIPPFIIAPERNAIEWIIKAQIDIVEHHIRRRRRNVNINIVGIIELFQIQVGTRFDNIGIVESLDSLGVLKHVGTTDSVDCRGIFLSINASHSVVLINVARVVIINLIGRSLKGHCIIVVDHDVRVLFDILPTPHFLLFGFTCIVIDVVVIPILPNC